MLLASDRAETFTGGFDPAITVVATVPDDVDATRVVDLPDAARDGSRCGAADPESLTPGTLVADRYRLVGQLGKGGMGVVYLAHDERLEVQVALKCLPRLLARDPLRLEQFRNEVRLARLISHPNVCRVHDIGEIDGQPFLTMEYIEGEDLAARLRTGGPFPEGQAVELLRGICAGLHAVHGQGILHRDLKPANVMLNSAGQPQLMDFGIADAAARSDDAERGVAGTIAYMAPELLRGSDATVQSDLYALGHVMYEVVTGKRVSRTTPSGDPQQQEASRSLVPAVRGVSVAVSAELSARVRPRLREAILRCLDPDPAKRPDSVQDVTAMLQSVLLDARTRVRRLVQVVAQLALLAPVLILFYQRSLGSTWFIAAAVAAVVVLVLERQVPLGWAVQYKGHSIAVQNHVLFGERLLIDGTIVDRGRARLNVTLRGTIETGAGAGERITAQTKASFSSFSCRLVAESFRG